MEIFLDLVDSNAQIAAYKKSLGLSKDDIMQHIGNITFYREVISLTIQIRTLLKNKKDNRQEIEGLRSQLKTTVEEWKHV